VTAKLALFRRVTVLENLPTAQKPMRIMGGLPGDFAQPYRATVRLPTGHIFLLQRKPTESINSFLHRIGTPGAVVTLGGLPPLPGSLKSAS
jgi:hypothetical protein